MQWQYESCSEALGIDVQVKVHKRICIMHKNEILYRVFPKIDEKERHNATSQSHGTTKRTLNPIRNVLAWEPKWELG